MIDFSVEVTGDEELRAKLEKFAALVSDMRLFSGAATGLFIGWMRDVFDTEGGALGTPWSPLSPAYAVEKSRKFPGKSILIREGTLRQAASRPRREATPRSLTFWIDDPVAGYHEDGTATMPARPLIPDVLPPTWQRELDEAAAEHVNVLIRGVGL